MKRQSFSAPNRASECSMCTLPRRRTTSSALYGRSTPFQRGLVCHSLRSCSAAGVVIEVLASVDFLVRRQGDEGPELGRGGNPIDQRGGAFVVAGRIGLRTEGRGELVELLAHDLAEQFDSHFATIVELA